MQHCTVNGLGDTMFRRRSLESCLRSKDSRAVWRGAVGTGPQGTSLAAYPTARPVLNGEVAETDRQVLRLVLTQRRGTGGSNAARMHQPRNEPVLEERVDVLRVRP